MSIDTATAGLDNPYIIGRPIYERKFFFGREDLFRFLQDNLKQGVKIILLHGQRRIGKSSVLSQITNFVQLEQFVFIPLSLQGKSHKPLGDVLHELAVDITDYLRDELDLSVDNDILPSGKGLKTNVQLFTDKFLPQVYEFLYDKNLVLLLDEFDVLDGDGKDAAINQFFPYLKSIVERQEKLFIIPVVGRQLEDMHTLVLGLFKEAPKQEIGLLNERNAERLIIEPAKGVLEYNPDAIQAIRELSAGHPYFTQVLCFALFSKARDEQRLQVTRADVESVVEQAISIGEAGLAWFRDGLPIPERVVFSAVAEAQKIAALKAEPFVGEPLTLLKGYGVAQTVTLAQAGERLVEWDFLELAEGSDLPLVTVPKYKVKVELVRRWLVKKHPLRQEIWELEKLEPAADSIYKSADDLRIRYKRLTNAIPLYEQALAINPNYFTALFELAEGYLDIENFSKAIELYHRAYQVDPVRTQEGFLGSLLGYGNKLIEQGKLELAKDNFQQVLAIQPENALAQERLREIEEYKVELDLLSFYKALNPSKTIDIGNAEERQYYIDFSSVRGGDSIKTLGRTITHISPDQSTCQLFTGHMGCGKSVELLRLKAELEQQGFHVVYFQSSQDIDMTGVDVADIFLAIARHVSESLEKGRITFKPRGFKALLQGAAELLQTEITISAESSIPGIGDISITEGGELSVGFGIGKITAKAKDSPKFRRQLGHYLETRINQIVDTINQELLKPGIKELKRQAKKGLVVIVDNLDRMDSRLRASGRTLPEYLFVDRGEQLKQLNCHVVYTIPLLLIFSKELAKLRNRFGVEPKVLPMVPVQLRDGSECQEGMALLRQMVLARAFPGVAPVQRLNLIAEVFDSPDTLDRLCLISGGHVRNLLGLLYQCLQREDPPLSRDCLENVIRRQRESLVLAIDDEEWELLRQVAQRQTVAGEDEYQTLLRSLLVFEYEYGDDHWFGINPILMEAKQLQP